MGTLIWLLITLLALGGFLYHRASLQVTSLGMVGLFALGSLVAGIG